MNSQVNNLKGSKSETVSGWTFNGVKSGPWNENATQWGRGCAKASWFGWAWPEEASIIFTLHGKGKATLEFGNCHKTGNVALYLNDVKLSSVGANKEAQVEFEFNDGDVLKITENKAIIQFNNLRIVGCPEGKRLFLGLHDYVVYVLEDKNYFFLKSKNCCTATAQLQYTVLFHS